MTWEIWLAFVVTETALCFTPGPAVLLVISQGLARGTAASISANLGILGGNTMYFVLSATGLGAVLLASYEVFSVIRWVGAAYLVWLGVTTFLGKSATLAVRPADAAPRSASRTLLDGFVLQAANPKALVFFVALLPQFIDPRGWLVGQVAMLAVTSVVIEFFVLLAYGAAAGRMTSLATRPRYVRMTNRVAGTMLVGAGVGVAAIRR